MKLMIKLLFLTALAGGPALAQDTPRELQDMVGARAGQAEGELQRRGYRNMRGEKGDDRSYTYWWNNDRRQCVTIATMNGRYDSITSTPAPDCRQSNGGRSQKPSRQFDREAYGGDASDFSRLCKGEAAARFDRRPSEITTNAPIRQSRGTIVQGWYDREGGRTKFFSCRFDENDKFLSVM